MKQGLFRVLCVGVAVVAFSVFGGVPQAEAYPRRYYQVNSGNYMPLQSIITRIRARTPGRLIDAQGPRNGRYRIVWETNDGRVINFIVDAETGEILNS